MIHQQLYANFLKKFLKPQKPLKVIFDCSNGTTGIILEKLFQLNVEDKKIKGDKLKTNSLINYKLINEKPNGNFPAHGPDPIKPNALKQVQKEIKRQKADLGIIFDADGDRAFFIDDKGNLVDPDAIAYLLIWQLNSKKVIVTETTSWLVRRRVLSAKYYEGGKKYQVIKSQNGHSFIKKAMRKYKADFGCERSGHYYFSFPSFGKEVVYDSGILAAIQVINAVSKLPYKFSDFSDLLPQYFRTGDVNIKIQNPKLKTQELFNKIKKDYKKQAINISRIDGLRMEFNPPTGGWWFNVQPSNTEPIFRLNIEAFNKQTLAKEKKKVLDTIQKYL